MQKNIKLILALFSIALLFIAGCGSSVNEELAEEVANCLSEKGVKEYGAFWCPNCAKQEKKFGSAETIIKENVYIECDPRCDVPEEDLPAACRGVLGQTQLCLDKGIDKYPTWEFPDGSILLGVRELDELAEKVGCAI